MNWPDFKLSPINLYNMPIQSPEAGLMASEILVVQRKAEMERMYLLQQRINEGIHNPFTGTDLAVKHLKGVSVNETD